MNCFCDMVDRWKAFSLISSRDHCQRSSPSWISETPCIVFVEWSFAVLIITTPLRLMLTKSKLNSIETLISQALIELEISHKEFIKIVKEKEKYEKIKEHLTNINQKLGEKLKTWDQIVLI